MKYLTALKRSLVNIDLIFSACISCKKQPSTSPSSTASAPITQGKFKLVNFLVMNHNGTPFKLISIPAFFVAFMLLAVYSCKKEPPGNTTPPSTAEGSLQDAHGYCMVSNAYGVFFTGLKSDTSYVEIGVNVTKTGSYHITTDNQNGVQFTADGNFSDTGYTPVHLKANGLFKSPGQTYFLTAFNASACNMSVRVMDSTWRDQADNTWEFTAGGHVYKGTGSAAYYHLPTYVADNYIFYGTLEGRTDTSLKVAHMPFESWDTAFINHLTSSSNSVHFSTAAFAGDSAVTFDANTQTAPAAVITITVSPYSRVVTFNGTALDAKGNVVQITNARYRAVGENYIDLE